jgi:hypothetical protein
VKGGIVSTLINKKIGGLYAASDTGAFILLKGETKWRQLWHENYYPEIATNMMILAASAKATDSFVKLVIDDSIGQIKQIYVWWHDSGSQWWDEALIVASADRQMVKSRSQLNWLRRRFGPWRKAGEKLRGSRGASRRLRMTWPKTRSELSRRVERARPKSSHEMSNVTTHSDRITPLRYMPKTPRQGHYQASWILGAESAPWTGGKLGAHTNDISRAANAPGGTVGVPWTDAQSNEMMAMHANEIASSRGGLWQRCRSEAGSLEPLFAKVKVLGSNPVARSRKRPSD